jgi:hypothetical protein
MPDNDELVQLLQIMVGLWSRQVFPPEELRKIVAPTARSDLRLKAYNLCDGTKTRADVYKALKIDKDNFNKLANKWIEQGVMYELQHDGKSCPKHLYPLSKQ